MSSQPPYGPQQPVSPPPYAPPPQQPVQYTHTTSGTDSSRKFLNLSGGALMAVITAMVLVCCVGPIALCVFGGVFGGVLEGMKEPGKVTVTKCSFDGADLGSTAKIEYTVVNPGAVSASYTIKFVVRDAGGNVVGEATDWAFSLEAGAKSTDIVTVFLTGSGPQRCEVLSVE